MAFVLLEDNNGMTLIQRFTKVGLLVPKILMYVFDADRRQTN
jgi:hypothetical protein